MGYQPTYEELKREIEDEVGPGRPGYQPTYEELKRKSATDIETLTGVTSLPMRN